MAIAFGRQGWIGIAIEATPGAPLNPVDYIGYETNTLQGKITPIDDSAARGQREKVFSSVVQKKEGAGDVEVILDPTYSGYFFKMALGSEASAQIGTTGVYDHTFTVDENSTPFTATVMVDRSTYRENYTYSIVNQLDLTVKDGLATLKAAMMSRFPVTTASGTNTTASGTIFTFKDLNVRFGSTLAAAQGAVPTKVVSFNLSIKNNAELIYRSGSNDVDAIAHKNFEVSGDYDLLLESTTELNNYYNQTKQYAVFSFTGAGIGSSLVEQIVITLYKFRINEQPLSTGIDNLYNLTSKFVCEYSKADSKTMDITNRNLKTSVY